MTGRIGVYVVAGALALCMAGAASGAGDAAKGETMSKGCSCHKTRGDLNGVPADTLLAKMRAYKAGQGQNKAMISIMQRYSEEDLPDLAAYYSGLPATKK
ncbi:MAG: c-type cytochrome [Thermodesulfobacteriota bacterium]